MIKKIIYLFLIFSIIIVSNYALFQPKEANAIPTESIVYWDTQRDGPVPGTPSSSIVGWDRIIIYVWKVAIYPMLRNAALKVVAGSDISITWESVRDWFIKDFAFQVADAALREFLGVTLCADISAQIDIALRKMSDGTQHPVCTPGGSKVFQFAETLALDGSDAAWKKIKDEYYKSFSLDLNTDANDLNYWFDARATAEKAKADEQQRLILELSMNDGFLGPRDCTNVPKDKQGVNGINCPLASPGIIVADYMKGVMSHEKDSVVAATMKEDIAAILGLMAQQTLRQTVQSAYSALK